MLSIEESFALLECTPGSPSVDDFISISQSCRKSKNILHAMHMHAHTCHSGLEGHERLGNHLVPMFVECGSVTDAQRAFNKLVLRNECSWTGLIEGYTKFGEPQYALNLYQLMQEDGVHPSRYTFVALLKACASLRCVERGENVHVNLARKGFEKDTFVGSSLVDMYAKCGSLAKAQEAFDKLPNRDVSAWTALISGYVEEELGEQALNCFKQMQLEGVSPDAFTFVCNLKACGSIGSVSQVQETHAEIVKNGFERNPYVSSTLVDMYAKYGSLAEARTVLDELPSRDVFSWTALIAGCIEHGFGENALCCLAQMQVEGVPPNAITFTCCLKACCSLGAVDEGQEIHIEIAKMGLEKDLSVGNTLVDMYSKCGLLLEVEKVFDELPNRDVVSWTALIAGYAEQGLSKQVLMCLKQMQVEWVSPNSVTYLCCIKACNSIAEIDMGQALHTKILEKGFENDPSVGNTLVDMYAKCGALAEAREVFDKLADQDVVSWNTLITGYAEHGCGEEALTCFQRMQWEGVSPNNVTYVSSLKACGSIRSIDKGQELHTKIILEGLEREVLVSNHVINMYAKCGFFSEAWKVFEELPSRDEVSWNALIAGYADSGHGEEVLKCFEQMRMEGVFPDTISWNSLVLGYAEKGESEKAFELYVRMQDQGLLPDRVIFLSILAACRNTAALKVGRIIHAQICGVPRLEATEVTLANALIDMYGKCGRMADAQKVFDATPIKNHVTWSTLIAGYARQGESKLVLDLFEKAREEGVQPDGVAFLSVLSVCSHAGLADKGQKYFEIMSKEYGMDPTIEHFTCMVDLHSRAGQLNEALAMVKRMPFQPSLVVWLTVLGACRQWGNVELGRIVFDYAVRLEERHASVFILMSHIYTDAQMWEDAKKIEAMRMNMQAWKEPD